MNAHIERYLWGQAEFESHINRITVDVGSFLHNHLPPRHLYSLPTTRHNPAMSPSPLLRDVGSITNALGCATRSAVAPAPPLFRGMWAVQLRSTEELGRRRTTRKIRRTARTTRRTTKTTSRTTKTTRRTTRMGRTRRPNDKNDEDGLSLEGGMGEGETRGGTQEVGGTAGTSRKRSATFVVLRFRQFLSPPIQPN